MFKRTLAGTVLILFCSIAVISLATFLIVTATLFDAARLETARTDLRARANLVKTRLESATTDNLEKLLAELSAASDCGLTYLAGSQLFSSREDDLLSPSSLLFRKEFKDALATGLGEDVRESAARKQMILYRALRLNTGSAGNEIIRLSLPLEPRISFTVPWPVLTILSLFFLFLGGLSLLLLSRRITGPLKPLSDGVRSFARDNFTTLYTGSSLREIKDLTLAINETAANLGGRIGLALTQSTLSEAVLSGMLEGVIAVNSGKRVLLINHTAKALFHLPEDGVLGRRIEEVIAQNNVLTLIEQVSSATTPVEDTFIDYEEDEHWIEALGIKLMDPAGGPSGVLIVLRDVTRLRKLETVRKEFAMNVSHELKTPLTSIKGFVETLKDSGLADGERNRFLEIIAKETERVIAIVDDLLSLARLEKESERGAIELSRTKLLLVLKEAVEICGERALKKEISLTVDCPNEIEAVLNPRLFEQAIVNLLDNAIKYSGLKSAVSIRAERKTDELLVAVRDNGAGIALEHFERLFERFYRVDKARSSELGGTGLGLAIVKHIILAHHGRVDLESELGRGSVFYVHLPLPE